MTYMRSYHRAMGHRSYHFTSMVANSVTVLQKCCFEENQEKKSL